MKRLAHAKRLAQMYFHYLKGSTRLPYLPVKLWVESTNACNLRCPMCPNATAPEGYRMGHMDLGLFAGLVDQIRGRVYHVNLHHRGEPLLHPELPRMIAMLREADIRSAIHTNATRLSPDKAEAIIRAGLDFISFSVDGYDKDSYEAIRRGAIFEKTLHNIRAFLQIKEKLHSATPYAALEFIDFSYQPEELAQLETLAADMDHPALDRVIIKKIHNWAGTTGDAADATLFSRCTFPWYALVVFYNGRVCPCPQDFFGTLDMGGLTERALADIWNGPELRELRGRMALRDVKELAPCDSCDLLRRKTFLGVPANHMRAFLRDHILGIASRIRSGSKIKRVG